MAQFAGPDHTRAQKVPTGIDGFDHIAGGGLPRARTTLVTGAPGTGKTVFGLQVLADGALHHGEPGIFAAFEESSAQIIENASGFKWAVDDLVDNGLYFFNARLPADVIRAGAFDLSGLLASLKAKADQVGAKRIVFDSFDAFLAMIDDPVAERQELCRVHDWLATNALTGLVTARPELDARQPNRNALLQFMADCVVLLDSRLIQRAVLRELRIQKYRGSAHEQNTFPFVIGPSGIEVASFGALPMTGYPVSSERISTGIGRLDAMLDGGYYRGSSVLVTGAPGTAKTTLGGAFAEAACMRGEKTLYVGFDEAPVELVRNLACVNIRLEGAIKAGQLVTVAARSEAHSAEIHLVKIRDLMLRHDVRCLVVDPISAIQRAGGELAALPAAARLVDFCKAKGITFLCTSQLPSALPETVGSEIHISSFVDCWIHLTYVIQGGERNRALSIIKSRGTPHSNQVRELVLTKQGLTLTDVYAAEGGVLMGALRMQKEAQEQVEREMGRAASERERHKLEFAQARLDTQLRGLQIELEAKRAELEAVRTEAQLREQKWAQRERALRRIRGADTKGGSSPT